MRIRKTPKFRLTSSVDEGGLEAVMKPTRNIEKQLRYILQVDMKKN